jgi:hypothetical protein
MCEPDLIQYEQMDLLGRIGCLPAHILEKSALYYVYFIKPLCSGLFNFSEHLRLINLYSQYVYFIKPLKGGAESKECVQL